MGIPDNFLIDDIREQKDFHMETFSGYKKLDVFKALFKSIETYKIEETCNWTIELLLSCQTSMLYEKFILYSSKYINILNPNLPSLLCNRYTYYKNLNLSNKEAINNQTIRNHLIEIALALSFSNKTKATILPKMCNNDFKNEFFIKNLKARDQSIISKYSQKNDPVVVNIILNELWDRVSNKNLNEALYFLNWLIIYDKNKKFVCASREVEGLSKKYYTDFNMYIWYIFLNESYSNSKKQSLVSNLFELSLYQYTKSKSIMMIIHAIKLLCANELLDINQPSIVKRDTMFQVISKVNFLVLSKKKFTWKRRRQTIKFETQKKQENNAEDPISNKEKIVMSLDTMFNL
jgi:hypothetical protein